MFNPKDIETDSSFDRSLWNADLTEEKARFYHRVNQLFKRYLDEYADSENENNLDVFESVMIRWMHFHWTNNQLSDSELAHLVDSMIWF